MYVKPKERLTLDWRYLDTRSPKLRHLLQPPVKLEIPLAANPPLEVLHIDAGADTVYLSMEDVGKIENFILKTKTLTHLYLGRIDYDSESDSLVVKSCRSNEENISYAIRSNTSLMYISIHTDLLQFPALINCIIANQSIREVRIFDDRHDIHDAQVEALLYRLITEKKNMTSLHLDARTPFSCTKFIGALADNTTLLELALLRCKLTNQDVTYLASTLKKNNHLKRLTINSGYTEKKLVLDMLEENKSLIHVNLFGDGLNVTYAEFSSLFNEVHVFLRRNRITSMFNYLIMINLLTADKGCQRVAEYIFCHMLVNMPFSKCEITHDYLMMQQYNEKFMGGFPSPSNRGRSQEKMLLQEDFSLLGNSLFREHANAAEALKSMLVEKKAIPCIRQYLGNRRGLEHGGIVRAGSLLQVFCSPDVTLNCKLLVLDAFISTGVGTIGVDKGTDLVKDLRKCFKSGSESKCIKDTAQLYAKANQLDLLQTERAIIKKINGVIECEQITDAYLLQQKSFWSFTF